MTESSHILGNFERALTQLSDDIIEMGNKVEGCFEMAVHKTSLNIIT